MNADEHQKQLDEQQIAAGEHERDLRRESQTQFEVRCWGCHKVIRYSQWPGMWSRHEGC